MGPAMMTWLAAHLAVGQVHEQPGAEAPVVVWGADSEQVVYSSMYALVGGGWRGLGSVAGKGWCLWSSGNL